MPQLRIHSHEPLFFRDGRPFTLSDSPFSQGVFPPNPSTVYGALGAVYLRHIQQFVPVEVQKLRITQFQLAEKNNFSNAYGPLWTLPLDMMDNKYLQLQKKSYLGGTATYCLMAAELEKPSTASSFLRQEQFARYLNGSNSSTIDIADWLHTDENKFGIAREQGMVKEGMLYRYNRIRMAQKLSFWVSYEGLELPTAGSMGLGSDATVCHFQQIADLPVFPKPDMKPNTIFKYVLTTPWLFKDVSQPFGPSINIEILAKATARPLTIGGFDMQTASPTPMYKALPAGTVLFLRATDEKILESLLATYHGKPLDGFLSEKGYGIGYFAKLPNSQNLTNEP